MTKDAPRSTNDVNNVLSASVGTPFICVAYHLKSMEFARFIDVSIETKYSIRSDFIDSANSFEAALEALHTDGEMERYTQLLNEKISVTNLKYNEMIMNVLKDVDDLLFVVFNGNDFSCKNGKSCSHLF